MYGIHLFYPHCHHFKATHQAIRDSRGCVPIAYMVCSSSSSLKAFMDDLITRTLSYTFLVTNGSELAALTKRSSKLEHMMCIYEHH